MGGWVRGVNPPPSEVFFFFCLSVYENSRGPGGCFNKHDGLSDGASDHSAMDK